MKNNSYLSEIIVLFTFLLYVHLSFGTRIYPDVSELIIKKGSKLTLNCTSDEPVQWYFPKESKSYTKKVENEKVENGTKDDIYRSNLTISPTLHFDTGYFICRSENNASNAAQIYVYCFDESFALAASSSVVDASMYDRAEIPCKPTSPNISVILTRSTVNVEPTIEKYDPKIGFVISTHSIIGFATFHCYAPDYRRKSKITVRVHPPHNGSSSNPHIEAFNSNSKYPIFENQNATINCSVITSIYTEIKSLEWQFPKNVEKKIIIGDITDVKHDARKFIAFFQSLSINNVTKEDQGNYSCKVVDGDSRTKVSTYSLQIADWNSTVLNVIPEKSDTVTVRAGQNSRVELVGIIEAFPNPTTRTWYDSKGRKIRGFLEEFQYDIINEENKTKLRIYSVELKNLGIYQLVVNNSLDTKTLNFTVIVEDKPVISNYMRFMSRFLNLNVTYFFECIIDGYPLPEIRWSVINCYDYPTCSNNIVQYLPISQHEEECSEVYSVRSRLYMELDQSMRIRCEANNSLGSATSSSFFFLTDYGTEVVLQENYTKPITIGDNIDVTCAASKYAYTDNFTWFFEKNKIIPSQGIQIKNYSTNFSYVSTLSIKDIQKNHSGMYFCRTSFKNSSLGISKGDIFVPFVSEYNNIFLAVQDVNRPSVVHSNMNGGALHVVPGSSINFVIQVDGLPSPVVVWYKDGKPLSFNDHITLNNLDNEYLSLSIENVSREDGGVYSFFATNKGGKVTDKLQLIVKGENEKISVDSGTIVENVYFNYIFGFSIFFFLSLGYFVLWSIRKLNKEKKRIQKKLEEYGLEEIKGCAVPSLDPNLDIAEQTSLIPYNEKYEFPREKLEFGDVLGLGVFGIVRKAEAVGIIEKNVRTTVAVKVAKNQHESLFVKALASELKIMIYLGQHPNVVNLLGACTKDLIKGELSVIVEYCKYGNLRNFLLKQRNNFVSQIKENDEIDFSITTPTNYENIPFRGENGTPSKNVVIDETPSESDGCLKCDNKLHQLESRSNYLADYDNIAIRTIYTSDLVRWSFQTALGMDYLASRKILHGDLAARNILLTEGFIAKICDFGFAKSMYQNQEYQCSKTILPVKWMAIESIEDRVFSTQSDVWAFGVTMWEIFSLAASPYPGVENATDLYEKLVSGYRMGQPKFATNRVYCLMKDCWNHCPQLRPSFAELCEKIVCILEDSVQSPNIEENKMSSEETKTGTDIDTDS